MIFAEFQKARLIELCNQPRTLSLGEATTEHDFARGVVELLQVACPKSIIEIGSYRGVSTEIFLLTTPRVVAVDPWDYPETIYDEFMLRCGSYPGLEVCRGKSPEALKKFKDEFDLCYIDGEHTYDALKVDIEAAKKIVKSGGYIAGHDYHMPEIRKAVNCFMTPSPFALFRDGSWLCKATL